MRIMQVVDKRGDTLIEVILAMTLLTMILTTGWMLSTRLSQVMYNARTKISMVDELRQQAELLQNQRDTNQNFLTDDNKLLGSPITIAAVKSLNTVMCSTTETSSSFYINLRDPIGASEGKKKIGGDDSKTVWIEAESVDSDYIDFYIRGCWSTLGGSQKEDNSQIVLRLKRKMY